MLGLLSMPFGAAAGLPSAGGAELAADAERQNPLLRHCGGGAGSGLGLCGHAVAGARDLLCPRRYAMGMYLMRGGRRSAGVYVFSLTERAAPVLVGHAALPGRWRWWCWFPVCWPRFSAGLPFARRSKGLFLDHDQCPDLCRYAAVLRNETGFMGNNGFTGFTTLLGFPVTATGTRASLFMATVLLLLLTLWLGSALAE